MLEGLIYLMASFWLGAVHAATPGHGKTIAASYIIGARGRPVDAVVLGIFVTLSHTSGIIIVAVLATLGSAWLIPQRVEAYLAVGTGVLVVGIGAWMLRTQALFRPVESMGGAHGLDAPGAGGSSDAGDGAHGHSHDPEHSERAPVHGTHTHSHEHGALEHSHDEGHAHAHAHGVHEHTPHGGHEHPHVHGVGSHSHGWGPVHTHDFAALAQRRPSLAMLLGLGIAGGLLPDPGALAILLSAIAGGKLILGLFTVVVFSLGFASVLVVVGMVAARVGKLILTWLESRWVYRVQIAAAVLIIGIGLVLTASGLRAVAALA
jgi:nickel/cobalt exporter